MTTATTTDPLAGMTQAKWDSFTPLQREQLRDLRGLTKQLIGYVGYRVEVVDAAGDKPRRFIVGMSTGWRPCHLEISRRSARGGGPASKAYYSVRGLEKVR